MLSLPKTEHKHHDLILEHVEHLPQLADLLTHEPAATDEFRDRFEEELHFVTGTLLPHAETVESRLYPAIEQILSDRHSMSPMRLEHAELRRLAGSLARFYPDVAAGHLDRAGAIALRRALYRLYAILKVHLAEEELYLDVLERNLSPEELDALSRAMAHATSQPV